MQIRQLGSLTVPVIGMGSASSSGFNVESPEEVDNCQRILNDCLASGATFLDTSPMYRRAEGVIGAGISGRRHRFQLATKVYCAGVETGSAQIQRSFDLLGTNHIEVFQIHNLVDWRTHLAYLEELKAEGRIGVIGITHYQPPFYEEMALVMRTGRVDAIQIPYSLLEREAEEELLPLAAEMGIDGGVAGGIDGRVEGGVYNGKLTSVPPTGEARSQALADFADEHGCDLRESVAYADSSSDLPMLEVVGFPVAVNPETKLAAIARRRGWLIEHWTTSRGAPVKTLPLAPRPRPRHRPRHRRRAAGYRTPGNGRHAGGSAVARRVSAA